MTHKLRIPIWHLSFITLFLTSLSSMAQVKPQWAKSFLGVYTYCSVSECIDLNDDGTKDLIVGAGREWVRTELGVLAVDGKNGAQLWSIPARNLVFGTPVFYEANHTKGEEVLISGKNAQLWCIEAKTGKVVWEFWPDSLGDPTDMGWYNFYSPQIVRDQNNDGIDDILIANGGDATKVAEDTIRDAGSLLIISGKDGQVLNRLFMPDKRETYFSALLVPFKGEPHVMFGSGGETMSGSLWLLPFKSLQKNNTNGIIELKKNNKKGFIAVPSMIDLTGDGIVDWVVPSMQDQLTAFDGHSGEVLWEKETPNIEGYISPTPGYFNEDDVPDIFCILALGSFPDYKGFKHIVIDGTNGSTIWEKTTGVYQLTSALALDCNADGIDELLLGYNFNSIDSGVHFKNQLQIVQINKNKTIDLLKPQDGLIVYATPLLKDLDDDGKTDLIVLTNKNIDSWFEHDSFQIARYQFNKLIFSNWPGYLGPRGDGITDMSIQLLGSKELNIDNTIKVTNYLRINGSSRKAKFELYNSVGKAQKPLKKKGKYLDFSELKPGFYTLYVSLNGVRRQYPLERIR